MTINFKKVVLVVLDGFGIASAAPGNAETRAEMTAFSSLINHFPSVSLQAAGPNVGLPWGEPGNSEVGHMCLGAGRIVLQDLPRIDKSIISGEYSSNPALNQALDFVKKNNSTLHLVGLLGEGRVHASQLHLYSLLTLAAARQVDNVVIHVITDGRDTRPDAALEYLNGLEKKIIEVGVGRIVSISGRFYAMDRANHWDLIEAAHKAIALGEGEVATSASAALQHYYEQNIFDETVPPTVIVDAKGQATPLSSGDAVIYYNFRTDRAIQLTKAFVDPSKTGFAHSYPKIDNLLVVTMTEYTKDLPVVVAFPKLVVPNTLSETVSLHGKKQYHVSESEKFPHVTYFFSNGNEVPYPGEIWDQVSSNASYQERYQNVPQMSAPELTARLLEKLNEPFDFYLANYANPDMVGHTGSLEASVKALKTVDTCLEQLVKQALRARDIAVVITADHGNVENIHDIQTGRIRKAHTTNPVPVIVAGAGLKLAKPREEGYLSLATQIPEGLLSDVAPTVLDLMGLPKPSDMTGISLLPILLKQLDR